MRLYLTCTFRSAEVEVRPIGAKTNPECEHAMPTPLDLTRLAPTDLEEAAGVLGRAAVDDPIFVHCLPDPAERDRGVPQIMQAFLRLGLTHGEVWSTPGPIAGVAWWSPPDDPKITPAERDAAGFTAVAAAWGAEASGRLQDFVADISEAAAALGDRPHWHLSWIGVEPGQQGKGVGSALLRRLASKVDASGVECELFDFVPENVPLYEHFGYEVASDSILPRTGLRLWAMIRQAQPAAGVARGDR
jgi:ribosomal protein S18 acetylase RimI-like enzyme